jgi:DNA-directed RNA polymerase subunit RPC12/RpoP
MDEMNATPAWKRSKLAAGVVMLLKGFAPPTTVCAACQRTLVRADGQIDVRFGPNRRAYYDCPHCGSRNETPLVPPEVSPYG